MAEFIYAVKEPSYGLKEEWPSLVEVAVVRETAKMLYPEVSHPALGYARQIAKDDRRVHHTPEDALRAFMDLWSLRARDLAAKAERARKWSAWAKGQLPAAPQPEGGAE